MDSLQATFNQGANLNGSNKIPGLGTGNGSSNNITKTSAFKTGLTGGNTAVLGADEAHEKLYTIAASGTVTIDLTSVVNLAGATVSFARLKAYRFHLLKASEKTPDGVSGTACSKVTIGNAGSNAVALDLGGTTPTMSVQNGSCKSHTDESAAGICTVDSTHKNLLLTNNDSVNVAQLYVTLVGGSN